MKKLTFNPMEYKGGGVTFTPGTADCGYDCAHTIEYGFAPEADCPVHDIKDKSLTKGSPTV